MDPCSLIIVPRLASDLKSSNSSSVTIVKQLSPGIMNTMSYTQMLPVVAEHPKCLRHAMVAFSSLIYSVRVDRGVRQIAFWA